MTGEEPANAELGPSEEDDMTLRKTHCVIWGVILLFLAGGCTHGGPSYESRPATEPISGGVSKISGEISVIADPYTQPERQESVFFADFSEPGILVVRIAVRNGARGSVMVRGEDIFLVLPGGHRSSRLRAGFAAAYVRERTGRSFNFFTDGILGEEHRSFKDDMRRAGESKTKRIADYEGKEFKDVILAPGASEDGFVFFLPPPGTPAFDAAKLEVQLLSEEGALGKTVAIPLSGLNFAGREPDPAAVTYVSRSQRGFRKCNEVTVPAKPWMGKWKARGSSGEITLDIADGTVDGKVNTPTHVYEVTGAVNASGQILAEITYRNTQSKAVLQGIFPKVEVIVQSTVSSDYRPLKSLAFRLCS